ncbi:MAG: hypothetical protein AAF725_22780 [Acidobacteriota bacterium]
MSRFLTFVPILLCLLTLATPAAAQEAWIIDSFNPGDASLAIFDFANPVPAQVGPIDIPLIRGMTGGGPGGDLYLVNGSEGLNPVPLLYRLDPIGLELEVIGAIDTPSFPAVRDLAVLPDGRILMSADVGPGAGLYTLDPATGSATLIAQMADPPVALAVLGGRVFAGARTSPGLADYALYELDPQTGALTLLFPVPNEVFGGVSFMAPGPDGNLLYATSSFSVGSPPGLLIDNTVIDPATGILETFRGSEAGPPRYQGLALVENRFPVAVPSLSGASLPIFLVLLLAAGLTTLRYRA